MSSKPLSLQSKVKLNNNAEIPHMGFGTYETSGLECYNAVYWALEAGYRLIDSAEWYGNEAECGRAIRDFMKKTGTPRTEIYFTTKLKVNAGYEHARGAIRHSLLSSGMDYLDTYLIHSPYPNGLMRQQSWQAITEAVAEGLIITAGVSNYGIRHLEELYATKPALVPAINQFDVHPFMTREKEVAYCKKHNMTIEAWSPLARGLRFTHPVLVNMAERHNRHPAQIMLRWSLQKGYIPLPKSTRKDRIIQNTLVFDFELTDEEIQTLDKLDEYLVTDWDPIGDPAV